MEGALTILMFFGVIATTALVFCVWLVVGIVKLIARGMAALFGPLPPMPGVTDGIACRIELCGASNPAGARFCRRCGSRLPQVQHVSVRRAAMW